jgi:hypothetical protein
MLPGRPESVGRQYKPPPPERPVWSGRISSWRCVATSSTPPSAACGRRGGCWCGCFSPVSPLSSSGPSGRPSRCRLARARWPRCTGWGGWSASSSPASPSRWGWGTCSTDGRWSTSGWDSTASGGATPPSASRLGLASRRWSSRGRWPSATRRWSARSRPVPATPSRSRPRARCFDSRCWFPSSSSRRARRRFWCGATS